MGCGKSTVGKLVSKKMTMPFVDVDALIEVNEKATITEIFKQKGESYFRKIERDTLNTCLKCKVSTVISTGGGAPCFYNNMDRIINQSLLSIYLNVGRDALVQRLKNDILRPLLQQKESTDLYTFIDSKLKERKKYYYKADKILRGIDAPEIVANRIEKYYKVAIKNL
ncbi:MAG: shikimate kinase [Saprospiraceae bacterium]